MKNKEIFIKEYIIDNDIEKNIFTTDKKRVFFKEEIFDHAFTRDFTGVRIFDFYRARRVYWIKPVIEERVQGATVLFKDERYKIPGKKAKSRRIYYVPEKDYVVILDYLTGQKKDFKFITHYLIINEWIKRKVKKQFGIE